ncbi:hydrogenase expression/formation protein HypE [Mangrovitalea sediminis]|uniref:hydrogenase expression/formation protein HypE n=1 Tax=Mangrovitalea sediminis TaxID=1982043 RepID=UPI000BE5B65A|nr:hydrogenase expression/formation protein HypE [Mangrovitalea sediminis]
MHDDRYIQLAHGNGGRRMRELIASLFVRHFGDSLNTQRDAAPLPDISGDLMITTDSFTVNPLEFPGGNIGSLAVHGTLNDLAVAGAEPRYLTVNALIEEGFEIARLDRLIASLGDTAREAGVAIVAGDTKVVARGEGGGLYLVTTGIGTRVPRLNLGLEHIEPGDRLLVSGPIGDHGIAVMLAREQFGLSGSLTSDAACVLPLTRALHALPGLRFMRDPTRGGLATVTHEIREATGYGMSLEESAVPVRAPVKAVCEMLGYDPYYLACEGRVVAVVSEQDAEKALALWRALPQGADAAIIGTIDHKTGPVVLTTSLGGQRVLDELEDDPLPRIC